MKITEAIQVCLTLNETVTKQREVNGLVDAIEAYHLKQGLILTNDEEGEERIVRDEYSNH